MNIAYVHTNIWTTYKAALYTNPTSNIDQIYLKNSQKKNTHRHALYAPPPYPQAT